MLSKKEIGNVVSASFVNGEYLPNWHKYEDYSSSYASKKSTWWRLYFNSNSRN